ncbi:MAG: thioesterase family protein [Verrucomicrobiales bacterium]
MAYRFIYRRTVAFSDTDLAGIVHFAQFFTYMEDCEHAFYRSLDYSVHRMNDGEDGWVGWPRIHASCDYRKPLRFEDEIEVELIVAEVGNKTIEYRFQFRQAQGETVVIAAEGKIIVACVRFVEGAMESVKIPQAIRDNIEQAPEEVRKSFVD